jgi:hypothetical protein
MVDGTGMAKEFFLRAHDCTCSALLKVYAHVC